MDFPPNFLMDFNFQLGEDKEKQPFNFHKYFVKK